MRSTRPAIHVMPLPPLPETEKFIDYLNILVTHAIRPDGLRKPPRKSDIARAIGISPKQLGNLLNGRSDLPQLETFEGILKAFFGIDPAYAAEWRAALAKSWAAERGGSGTAQPTLPDDGPSRSPTLTASAHLPVRVPTFFHGRDEVLLQLHEGLDSTVGRIIVVGPHGVGKTSLAARYAHHYREHYAAVAWIDARTAETCANSLAEFGTRMGWSHPNDAASITLDRLAASMERILLVYDNATDAMALNALIPNGESSRILVTSNSHMWTHEGRLLHLAPWALDVAAAFLLKRLDVTQARAAERIADALDRLPLALELAATFCQRRRMTLDTYLALLEASPQDALPLTVKLPNYPRGLVNVIRLSLQAAESEAPGADLLLKLMSVLGQAMVPIEILKRGRNVSVRPGCTEVEFREIEDALVNWSLVQTRTVNVDGSSNAMVGLIVHRLPALAIQASITDVANIRKRAAAVLVEGWPVSLSNSAERYIFQNTETHAAALGTTAPNEDLLALYRLLANVASRRNAISPTIEFGRRAVLMASRLGLAHHPGAAQTLSIFGRAYLIDALASETTVRPNIGDEMIERLLPTFSQSLGKRHPFMRRAFALLTTARELQMKYCKTLDPDIALISLDLARVCDQLGKEDLARDLRDKVFRQRMAFWPASKGDRAVAYAGLGLSRMRSGHVVHAADAFARALIDLAAAGVWRHFETQGAAIAMAELLSDRAHRRDVDDAIEFSWTTFSRHHQNGEYIKSLACLAIADAAKFKQPKVGAHFATRSLAKLPKGSIERGVALHILIQCAPDPETKSRMRYVATTDHEDVLDRREAAFKDIIINLVARATNTQEVKDAIEHAEHVRRELSEN